MDGGCYRKVVMTGTSQLRTFEVVLYLSPDQRYLFPSMMDTTVDPIEAERQEDESVMKGLLPENSPGRGPNTAPVTIVEFSDFECPFCGRLAAMEAQVLPAYGSQVRVVFKHFPLSFHPWARPAAEAAVCAGFQNEKWFWQFHDYFFSHQTAFTKDNFESNANGFAKSLPGLDIRKWTECRTDELSLGKVLQDVELGQRNNIEATPTLFINGEKVVGIKSPTQLKELIDSALQRAEPKPMAAMKTGAGAR